MGGKTVNDDFDEWWEKSGHGGYWDARLAWIAAQHAERKRIIQLIMSTNAKVVGASWLIEAIDK